MSNLYEIAAAFRADLSKLEALDLDDQTFQDTLDAISGDLEEKVRAVAAFIKNLEAEAVAIKAARDDMDKRLKARVAKADRLRDYLLACLELARTDQVKGVQFDVKVKTNPPSLVIVDEDKLKFAPAEFFTLVPEHEEINKAKLKEALLAGREVPGAVIQRGKRLDIK
jgi:hypothetical protein